MLRLSQAATDTKPGLPDSMRLKDISPDPMSLLQHFVGNLFSFPGGFTSELVPFSSVHLLVVDSLACLPTSVDA